MTSGLTQPHTELLGERRQLRAVRKRDARCLQLVEQLRGGRRIDSTIHADSTQGSDQIGRAKGLYWWGRWLWKRRNTEPQEGARFFLVDAIGKVRIKRAP